jgi:hypothetical protein
MQAFKRAGISNIPLLEILYRGMLLFHLFRYRVKGRRKGAEVLVDLNRHPDPKAALEARFGELDVFKVLDVAAVVRAADEVLAAPPVAEPAEAAPHPPAAEAVADMGEISGLVAAEPPQPEPPQVSEPVSHHAVADAKLEEAPSPEPVTFGFIGFGVDEDPDFDEWHGGLGPDPATRPRLVVDNPPPKPPELSDAELLCLLPPKRPGDTAVGWEIVAHDVLRAHCVNWFCAQKLVKEQSAAHDWRPIRDVSAVSMRGSP